MDVRVIQLLTNVWSVPEHVVGLYCHTQLNLVMIMGFDLVKERWVRSNLRLFRQHVLCPALSL